MTLTYITGNSHVLIASIDRSLANFATHEEYEGGKSKKKGDKYVIFIDGIIGSTLGNDVNLLYIINLIIRKPSNKSLKASARDIEEFLRSQQDLNVFFNPEYKGIPILEIIYIKTVDKIRWSKLRFVIENEEIKSTFEKIELFPERIAMWYSVPFGEDVDILNDRMKNLTKKILENRFNIEKSQNFIKDVYIKSKRFSVGFGIDIYIIRTNNIKFFQLELD